MKRRSAASALAVLFAISALAGTGSAAYADEEDVFDPNFDEVFEDELSDEALEAEAERLLLEEEAAALMEKINSEGSVFNIECWDEELKNRMIEHYPGYVEIDGTTGTIGNVTVRWRITPEADNAYQNHLDSVILTNADLQEDERIDLFLVGNDFAVKYARSDYTLPLERLGITADELEDQFDYTKEIMTHPDGTIRGVSWHIWPGVFICSRKAALDTWGTDDPEEIQTHISDWDAFEQTAEELIEHGYSITASAFDTYDASASNIVLPWISEDNTIQIRDAISSWAERTKRFVSTSAASTADLWSEEWYRGMLTDGMVFCYPGAAWLVEYGMNNALDNSVGANDGWVVCEGPQNYITRGSWICAAYGTDNETLAADIMRKMTTSTTILNQMAVQDGDLVNSREVMTALKDDDRFTVRALGGQNPIGVYLNAAEAISAENITPYDLYCDEYFAEAMRPYFEGSISYEDAVDSFLSALTDKFPELSE